MRTVRVLGTMSAVALVLTNCSGRTDLGLGTSEQDSTEEKLLATRQAECVALEAGSPLDSGWLAKGYTHKSEGRFRRPTGQLGGIARGHFQSLQECEAVPFKLLPKAIFYGNLGTWGSLGLNDEATMFKTAEQVVARYDELCAEARADTELGDRLECVADLIAVTPGGRVSATKTVASALLAKHPTPITINVRTKGETTLLSIKKEVGAIFSGNTNILTGELLTAHPYGLSLDFEPQVVEGGQAIKAAAVNDICNVHRTQMTALGHKPQDLVCFLYEYGNPPMVNDPENLEAYIFPVLMSTGDEPRAVAELLKQGIKNPTREQITTKALEVKERFIDNLKGEYRRTQVTGCMFAIAPYLYPAQSDAFTFLEGIEKWGDKCDFYSFQ